MPALIPEIEKLTLAERIQLVEDLWDDLAAAPDAVPVHEWQKEELAARKAKFVANPTTGVCWEAVKQRIRNRHGA